MTNAEKMVRLDRQAAEIVFRYYLNHAQNLEYGACNRLILSDEERMILAKTTASTAAIELRHLTSDCRKFYSNSELFVHQIQHRISETRRETAFASFAKWSKDWSIWQYIKFLREAAKVFAGTWSRNMGGKPWANCAWYAAEFLTACENGRGYAPDNEWELLLCCCHNNARWLNKLGLGVVSILNMGLHASPERIIQISRQEDCVAYAKSNYASNGSVNNKFIPDWEMRFLPFATMGSLRDINPPKWFDFWTPIHDALLEANNEMA